MLGISEMTVVHFASFMHDAVKSRESFQACGPGVMMRRRFTGKLLSNDRFV